ncbi:MAG: 50S ribosomal protein L23 [Proteobacteria bacterium]|jgi:large subunit ribosomal protein L23|nr:50S ribosomal protein L23 [Pseudomonadota bacterium]
MNRERLMQVLVEPKISEKASRVADADRQYVFRVLKDATKPEIKAAVEELFSVKVEAVTVCNMPAKTRHFRGSVGVRQGWKKAYVKLLPDFELDFLAGE